MYEKLMRNDLFCFSLSANECSTRLIFHTPGARRSIFPEIPLATIQHSDLKSSTPQSFAIAYQVISGRDEHKPENASEASDHKLRFAESIPNWNHCGIFVLNDTSAAVYNKSNWLNFSVCHGSLTSKGKNQTAIFSWPSDAALAHHVTKKCGGQKPPAHQS